MRADEFVKRHCLNGTFIKTKESEIIQDGNEVFKLINNYSLHFLGYILNDISFNDKEVKVEEGLYSFANMDSHICYDNEGIISWRDYDTCDLYCNCSLSPPIFPSSAFSMV
jgi:hypothetical protein